jgi:hypothetical protein
MLSELDSMAAPGPPFQEGPIVAVALGGGLSRGLGGDLGGVEWVSRPAEGRASAAGFTPVLGFEPRSEAPQASRIIQCSRDGGFRPRSYPTRAPVNSCSSGRAERGSV